MAIDLVPLDATRQALLTPADLDASLAGASGAAAARVRAIAEHGMGVDRPRGGRGMVMHDPLAMALAVDPTLVEWESLRLDVGPDGETRRTPGAPNCRVARRVDIERFRAFLVARLWPRRP
jgi:inosine-uridine nucleoside N-ribohydrolase